MEPQNTDDRLKTQVLRITLAVAAGIAAFVLTYRSQLHTAQVPGRAGSFHGYACRRDCSLHEAGYDWAQKHGVTDRHDCPLGPHHSRSFTEGCWAYANEQSDADEGVAP